MHSDNRLRRNHCGCSVRPSFFCPLFFCLLFRPSVFVPFLLIRQEQEKTPQALCCVSCFPAFLNFVPWEASPVDVRTWGMTNRYHAKAQRRKGITRRR